MPKALGLHNIKKTFNLNISTSETKYHRGSLRSGQKLEVEGSIVILGDVNSGAEVIAAENIVVLGTLRGLAHAGANGNKDAIIAAGTLDAVQLRIANVVKEIDREEEILHKQAYIYIQDTEIVIE
jgi:septum site-determining protein MinC